MPGTAWIFGGISALCFGLALVLTQFGLRHQSAIPGAAASISTATLLFWFVLPFRTDGLVWQWQGGLIFLTVGLLFPAVVTLLTFEANRRMGPNLTGAFGNLAPLFAVGLAALALGEEPTFLQAGGIVTIVIGATMLTASRDNAASSWPLWVVLLPLAAALFRGSVQATVKAGLEFWPDPFAAVLIGYSVSSLVIVVAGISSTPVPNLGFTRRGVAWFAGVGVCNGVAVLTLYAALTHGPVTLVSPLVASYPLATLLLSRLLLPNVPLSLQQLLGVTATVAGVALLLTG